MYFWIVLGYRNWLNLEPNIHFTESEESLSAIATPKPNPAQNRVRTKPFVATCLPTWRLLNQLLYTHSTYITFIYIFFAIETEMNLTLLLLPLLLPEPPTALQIETKRKKHENWKPSKDESMESFVDVQKVSCLAIL